MTFSQSRTDQKSTNLDPWRHHNIDVVVDVVMSVRILDRRTEEISHVEKKVAHFDSRHQFTSHHLRECLVDDSNRLRHDPNAGPTHRGKIQLGRSVDHRRIRHRHSSTIQTDRSCLIGFSRIWLTDLGSAYLSRGGEFGRTEDPRLGPVRHSPHRSPYDRHMNFADKGIVVTGAAGGIGAALARHFHSLGARVVVSDLSRDDVTSLAEELASKRADSAWAVPCDVSTEEGNRDLVSRADALLSGIDLFFANAGIGTGTTLESTSEEDWNTAFDVNVHAHRWAAKYLVPLWLSRGGGYFCSTASAAGLLSQIGSMPYSVTKAAAVAFAESLQITYGDRGIRVSCLCPQGVNTNMLRQGDVPGVGTASSIVRAAGEVLEPDEVAEITAKAIGDEVFLILPHPQVADFVERKAADRDRWLAGMRKLQARVLGS